MKYPINVTISIPMICELEIEAESAEKAINSLSNHLNRINFIDGILEVENYCLSENIQNYKTLKGSYFKIEFDQGRTDDVIDLELEKLAINEKS